MCPWLYLKDTDTDSVLGIVRVNFNSLVRTITDDGIVLIFLFGDWGVPCTIINNSCFNWTSFLGQVERSIQKLKEKATWISEVA